MNYYKVELQGLLDFITTNETQIIERNEYLVVIKNNDMVLEASKGGMYGSSIEVRTYDYEDYVEQNKRDILKFKEKTIEDQREMVRNRIRRAAPHTGISMLVGNQ